MNRIKEYIEESLKKNILGVIIFVIGVSYVSYKIWHRKSNLGKTKAVIYDINPLTQMNFYKFFIDGKEYTGSQLWEKVHNNQGTQVGDSIWIEYDITDPSNSGLCQSCD